MPIMARVTSRSTMMMETEETTTAWVVALPTPWVPPFGVHAEVAADGGDDESGEEGLGEALDDVAILEGAIGVVEVGGAVETEQGNG